MAEQPKTTTRGRKPKTTVDTNTQETVDTTDMTAIVLQMQKQMEELKAELEKTKKEKNEAVGQNLDLQTLVDALKTSDTSQSLPNYVKVISLVPNVYNISTEADGKGTCYTFEELGESKVISLNDIQKIMGVSKYRKQAEEGYFYIIENEVNEYLRLNQTANTIEDINSIVSLEADDSVEKFLNLNKKLRNSLGDKMALDIANGKRLDRNKLGDIYNAIGLDIEEKARNLKKVMNK